MSYFKSAFIGTCVLVAGFSFGDEIYVPNDYTTIQEAINASQDGDEIIVMPGTYTSAADQVVNMLGKAVTLRSSDPSDPDLVAATIIDGEGARRGILCDMGETSNTIIEGFTIQYGYATGGANYGGGGMYNKNSSPNIRNCTFVNNTTHGHGGGMANYPYSDPTIENCTFSNNTASGHGGGLMCSIGSTPTMTGCTVTGNVAQNQGGGIYNDSSALLLTDTTVCSNTPNQIFGTYSGKGNWVDDFCPVYDDDEDGVDDSVDNCYLYNPDQADCNENGIGDVCDLSDQTSVDCDQNGEPDECQQDCDEDGTIDGCDSEPDSDNDGIPDNCEPDCNNNNIPDDFEIEFGLAQDCDGNGIPDSCDIEINPSLDCDEDDVIDGCQLEEDPSLDCNENGIFDACEFDLLEGPEGAVLWPLEVGGNGHWYKFIDTSQDWDLHQAYAESQGAYLVTIQSQAETDFVDSVRVSFPSTGAYLIGGYQDTNDPEYSEPDGGWKWVTGELFAYTHWASDQPDDDGFGTGANRLGVTGNSDYWYDIDSSTEWFAIIEYVYAIAADCNTNGIPDECDIANGTSTDLNANSIPDDCEIDCQPNGIPDLWEIKTGQIGDCNLNKTPDDCDIADGTSGDINSNEIPDECEPDCNNNGLPDIWDIEIGNETDCDGNDIPDSCEVLGQLCEVDCNVNGVPDACDIAQGVSKDLNANGVPDECECFADINGDGVVEIDDLLVVIGYYGSTGPIGDFDFDGSVNITDILLLFYYWGSCPEVECLTRTQWRVEDGGNDNWYAVISGSYTWQQGAEYATSIGGYLATITSAEENAFVLPLIMPHEEAAAWLGGYQDLDADDYNEPGGGWRWVTAEPWEYTNWNSGEPSNSVGSEHHLNMWGNGQPIAGYWNDHLVNATMDIVIEWSTD